VTRARVGGEIDAHKRYARRHRQWRGKFLRSLARSPSVALAARHSGVAKRTCYDAREADPEFASAWDKALNLSIGKLEHEGFKRALKNDSRLLEFYLKAHLPEIYRETSKLEIDGRVCGVLLMPQKEDKAP